MALIGNPLNSVAFLTDSFNGNGSTTAFTMSVAPATSSSILVNITGVTQAPSTYSVVGTTLTFSTAPPSGTANISVRYLGIPASGVTTTAYRTLTEFTATASQTTFTPPSYTVGFIAVYQNGVMLGSTDYTATNGTTVVLAVGALVGDTVTTESFYVSSVLNAIPATAGAVNSSYIASGVTLTSPTITGATITVASTAAPAFSAWASNTTSMPNGVNTKILFDTEEFDTNSNFASSRFTPTVAGYYQINASARIGMNGATEVLCSLYKNGSSYKRGFDLYGVTVASGFVHCNVNTIVYMNGTTDYIEYYAYQSSGVTNTAGGNNLSWFNGAMIRSA